MAVANRWVFSLVVVNSGLALLISKDGKKEHIFMIFNHRVMRNVTLSFFLFLSLSLTQRERERYTHVSQSLLFTNLLTPACSSDFAKKDTFFFPIPTVANPHPRRSVQCSQLDCLVKSFYNLFEMLEKIFCYQH